MAEELAAEVAKRLNQAVTQRGQACLSVGGGRFPKPFFQKLSKQNIAWEHVCVVLGDERWVNPTDEASNEKLVRENLLSGPASAARFVGLKTGHKNPADALTDIEARLQSLPSLLDVTIVGMGEDGHTASLFPSAAEDELEQALSPSNGQNAALMHPTVSDVPRITLTLPRLKASRWLVIAAPGSSKLETFEMALSSKEIRTMPVRALIYQNETPVEFWWAP